jgi:hypothetical protein
MGKISVLGDFSVVIARTAGTAAACPTGVGRRIFTDLYGAWQGGTPRAEASDAGLEIGLSAVYDNMACQLFSD